MDWNGIDIQFGSVLKKTRESRGISQEKFAEKCGISRAYYGRLERGEHSATLKQCKKLRIPWEFQFRIYWKIFNRIKKKGAFLLKGKRPFFYN